MIKETPSSMGREGGRQRIFKRGDQPLQGELKQGSEGRRGISDRGGGEEVAGSEDHG